MRSEKRKEEMTGNANNSCTQADYSQHSSKQEESKALLHPLCHLFMTHTGCVFQIAAFDYNLKASLNRGSCRGRRLSPGTCVFTTGPHLRRCP